MRIEENYGNLQGIQISGTRTKLTSHHRLILWCTALLLQIHDDAVDLAQRHPAHATHITTNHQLMLRLDRSMVLLDLKDLPGPTIQINQTGWLFSTKESKQDQLDPFSMLFYIYCVRCIVFRCAGCRWHVMACLRIWGCYCKIQNFSKHLRTKQQLAGYLVRMAS